MGQTIEIGWMSPFGWISQREDYEAGLFYEDLIGRSTTRNPLEGWPTYSSYGYGNYGDGGFALDEFAGDDVTMERYAAVNQRTTRRMRKTNAYDFEPQWLLNGHLNFSGITNREVEFTISGGTKRGCVVADAIRLLCINRQGGDD